MTNDESECKCGANDGSTDGYHTKADHRRDCGRIYGPEACGGCWGCMAMTVAYWSHRRNETANETSTL